MRPYVNMFRITLITLAHLDPAPDLFTRFLSEEGFDPPLGTVRDSLAAMIAGLSNAVFLAWDGERPIGAATVRHTPSLEYGHYAEIEDLYVLPEARGAGAAKALIDFICAWCRERGCRRVEVCITPEGEAAHGLKAFYAGRGFGPTGRVLFFRPLA